MGMQAVLLVGGLGKRLRPLTETVPKAMVEVAGKPVLLRQIEWLRDFGVERFILAVSHLKEAIVNALGDGSQCGVQIEYAVEEQPLGTAGGLRNASQVVKADGRPILVMNGDALTNLNLNKLIDILSNNRKAIGVMALVPLPSPFGIVSTRGKHVCGFAEKPLLKDYWINAGIYCLRPEIFTQLPSNGSLEFDVFPDLANQRRLLSYKEAECFWVSVDGFKDLEKASTFYEKEQTGRYVS